MILEYYNEYFEPKEVEVEDSLYLMMETVINEGVFHLERTDIITNEDGTKLVLAVEKPGRTYGEDGDSYRITIEKIV